MASKIISGIAAAAFMAATCGSAFAGASITSTKGMVLVNNGSGFTTAVDGTQLKVGDRIMVGVKGKALVNFGKGCSLPIEPGRVVTVGAGNPCTTKAADLPARTEPSEPPPAPPPAPESSYLWWLLLVPPAAVGLCLLADCFDDDDSSP